MVSIEFIGIEHCVTSNLLRACSIAIIHGRFEFEIGFTAYQTGIDVATRPESSVNNIT
jgi:hypothetical protein